MKIRTQMILVLTAVALLPMGVAGIFAYRLSRARLDAQADQALLTLNRRVATEVDDFAFRALENVRSAARLPAIVAYAAAPAVPRNPVRQGQLVDLLLSAVVPDPVNVTSAALFDRDGRKLVDTSPRLDHPDEAAEPWLTRPRTEGLPVIVPVLAAGPLQGLWVASPVRDSGGALVGVLRLRYELSALQQIVTQATEERTSGVFIVLFDEHGRVLAHGTDPGLVGSAILSLPMSPVEEAGPTEPGAILAPIRWSPAAQAGGPPDRVALRRLTRVPWQLALAETGPVFHRAADDLRRTMLGLAALAVVLGGLAAILLSARLSRPIAGLATAAERIGQGDLSTPIPESGTGEVGRLARTFRETTGRLARTLGQLEESITTVRSNEEQLRSMLDAAPIGIVVSDEQMGTLLVNRTFTEMFGYGPHEISKIGDWWPLAYPDPAYRAEVQREWEARVAEADLLGVELRPMEAVVRCKDGTRRESEFRYKRVGNRRITVVGDLTERRRTAQALQTSEARSRVLLEHATDATVVLDADAERFIDCNPSFERMFKLTRDEVLRRGPRDISPPEQPAGREASEAGHKRTLEAIDGARPVFEWTHRDSTGRDFLCEVRLVRLPDPARRLVSAVIRDLEAQQRSIEQLRRSEQRFVTIFAASPVGLAIVALETGDVLDANPAACRIIGRPREEVVRHRLVDVLDWSPAEQAKVVEEVRRAGRTEPFERPLRAAGRAVTALVHCEAIEIDGQRRLLVALQDSTERNRTEQILRDSEERFRLLVENSNELVVQVTLEGIVLYASPNHLAITGRAPEEMLGTNVLAHVHPDDLAKVVDQFRVGSGQILFRFQFRDGSWHWLEASGRRYHLRSGEERGVVVSRDVSDRVHAEETRKSLEHQLRQAQKMEAIGTLAGGIAHDFNNILTGLLGHLQLLELDLPAEAGDLRRSLGEATAAGGRAKELVTQILAFSRQREQQRTVISLASHVREAVRFLRASLPATISIETSFHPGPGLVLADPTQMHQVLMNLGTNAAHAMRQRGGVLTIALTPADPDPAFAAVHPALKPGQTLCLTVADTGTGMAPETVERIFDPFFTTKPVGEGTGLGLAIVHSILQDHEAAIAVESRLGVGTTFRLYFPMVANAPVAAPAARPEAPRGGGQHVMLVDDELLVLSVAKPMLRRLGYRTTVFDRSRAALEAYEKAPQDFDLVVSDLTMPDLTGIELVQRMRALRPGQPVLIMTGYMRTADLESVRTSGVANFLSKPFTLVSLGEGIRLALQGQPSPPAT